MEQMYEYLVHFLMFLLGMLFAFSIPLAIYGYRLIDLITGKRADYKEEFAPGGTDVKSYIKCPLCLRIHQGHSSDKIHLGDIRWR